jgi:hypothetical protein
VSSLLASAAATLDVVLGLRFLRRRRPAWRRAGVGVEWSPAAMEQRREHEHGDGTEMEGAVRGGGDRLPSRERGDCAETEIRSAAFLLAGWSVRAGTVS